MSFKKGDLRRMLAVLGAIDELHYPTLVNIANALGWGPNASHSVRNLIEQAELQASVRIYRDRFVYGISSWGPILRPEGVRLVWHEVRDARTGPAPAVRDDLREPVLDESG